MSALPVSILTGYLRDHPSEGDIITAAYLIEQQAEQIAALRTALADAPHMEYCQFSYLSGAEHIRCTCWKAAL